MTNYRDIEPFLCELVSIFLITILERMTNILMRKGP